MWTAKTICWFYISIHYVNFILQELQSTQHAFGNKGEQGCRHDVRASVDDFTLHQDLTLLLIVTVG